MAKAYEKIADAYPDAVFLKVYGNANASCKKIFKLLKVRSTPAFIFFREAEVVATATGANKAKIEAAVREALKPEEVPGPALYALPLEPQPAAA